jgi:hypothetical protein
MKCLPTLRLAPLLLLMLAILLYMPPTANAEGQEIRQSVGAWQTVTLDIPLSKKVHFNTLTQMRESDNLKKADRFLQFAGVDYDLNKHWTVGAGYAWTPYWKNFEKYNNEQRAYERVMYRHDLAGGKFMARDQVEQRFISGVDAPATWNRILVQYTHPIPHTKGINAIVSDELLVQLYSVKHGPQEGFNQNRIFIGGTKDLNPSVQLQAGYMNWLQRSGAHNAPLTMSHVIMTQVNLRPQIPHDAIQMHHKPHHEHFIHQ